MRQLMVDFVVHAMAAGASFLVWMMPRQIHKILDHAGELTARLEAYDPEDDDESTVEEYLLERAALARARSELTVGEAVVGARRGCPGSGSARFSAPWPRQLNSATAQSWTLSDMVSVRSGLIRPASRLPAQLDPLDVDGRRPTLADGHVLDRAGIPTAVAGGRQDGHRLALPLGCGPAFAGRPL